MKNVILSAAVLLSVAFNATAATIAEPANEKVLKTFNLIFKDAVNVSWHNEGDKYEAFFTTDNIKTRALLDVKGNLIQTIRYYNEQELPSNVLYAIKNTYSGKEIHGVTEVSNKHGINYRIVLKDDKYYTHINSNNSGDTEIISKYKRGDK